MRSEVERCVNAEALVNSIDTSQQLFAKLNVKCTRTTNNVQREFENIHI